MPLQINSYTRSMRYFLSSLEAGIRALPNAKTNRLKPSVIDLDPKTLNVELPDLLSSFIRIETSNQDTLSKLMTREELLSAKKSLLPISEDDLKQAAFLRTPWQLTNPSHDVKTIFELGSWRFEKFIRECEKAKILVDSTLELTLDFLVDAYLEIRGKENVLTDFGLSQESLTPVPEPRARRRIS